MGFFFILYPPISFERMLFMFEILCEFQFFARFRFSFCRFSFFSIDTLFMFLRKRFLFYNIVKKDEK